MPLLGVNVAVIDRGTVLLTLRDDFEVWCLPGGHVGPGESLAAAAVREVREETGLDVRLDRLVGMYSRPRWLDGDHHVALFCATEDGGPLTPQPDEVLDARYVGLSRAAFFAAHIARSNARYEAAEQEGAEVGG